MTMRELLDVLKTATEPERLEFSEWWNDLPLPANSITVGNAFGEPLCVSSTPTLENDLADPAVVVSAEKLPTGNATT